MTAIKHTICNSVLLAPPGDENCNDLHIYRDKEKVASFWKPDEAELAALIRGGSVVLQVSGSTHPPLGLAVVAPMPDDIRPVVDGQEAHIMCNFIQEQFIAVNQTMQEAVAILNKELPNNPAVLALYDKYLDILGAKPTKKKD